MAEYTNVALQTVPVGQNVQFAETAVKCNKGYVQHREGSGVFTLRGITNGCSARYRVQFGGNIAVPTGGTVGAIGVSIAIAGEPLLSSVSVITPAGVNQYGNVTSFATIDVPKGCCMNIAVENISTTPIDIQNANLEIVRTA